MRTRPHNHFHAYKLGIIVAANSETRTTSAGFAASERQTMKFLCMLTAVLMFVAGGAQAQSNPAAAPADPTADLQRDTHDGLTVMASPLTDAAQSKAIFGKVDPMPLGILPVEVFLKNDSQKPIRVDIDTIQLTVHPRHGRQDLDWLGANEVASLIAHPEGVVPSQPRRVAGIPLPSNDKKAEKYAAQLRPLTLDGEVVPPMGMLHGYLYFNVSHEMKLADGATIYVPNVYSMPSNKPLMFFEAPIGKKKSDSQAPPAPAAADPK